MADQGYKSDVQIGGTDGSGGTSIGGVTSVSVTANRAELDVTSLDDTAIQRLKGLKDFTGSISGHYDSADSGQTSLQTNRDADGTTNLAFLYDGTNGIEADVHILEWSVDAAPDGTVTFSASFSGSDTDGFTDV